LSGSTTSFVLDPSGQYAYVTNNDLNTVTTYAVDGNGLFLQASASSVATGDSPTSISINPSGKFVYVTNSGDGTISQYTIGLNGALIPMAISLVSPGASSSKIVFDPTGQYAYVISSGVSGHAGAGAIAQFTVGVDGALTAMTAPSIYLTGMSSGPKGNAMTIDPSGEYVYVTGDNGQVFEFNIGANGQLSPMAAPALDNGGAATSIVSVSSASTTTSKVLTSDSWSKADGSHGSDTFNADGSSSGVIYNADGSSSHYTDIGGVEVTSGSATARADATSITVTGTGNFVLTGNTINDVINANSGNDTLVSGVGVDTLVGGTGNDAFVINNSADVVMVHAGSNINTVTTSVNFVAADNTTILNAAVGSGGITLTGNRLNDVIADNNTSANDTLIAGLGTDTLIGSGYDTFIVNNAADVIQALTYGATVEASVSYVASNNIAYLTGIGTADIFLTGSTQTQYITANSGNDTLIAGVGEFAYLEGGAGNDTFVINDVNDEVLQRFSTGINTLQTSVNYVLPSNVQNITGTGTGNLTLTGNAMKNVIAANSGNDTLIAGSGLATLVGGTGNDTFVINNVADVIQALSTGTNVNTVQTSFSYVAPTNVQKVTLTGSADLTVTGNTLADTLTANTGNDTLIAGAGIATLIGGSGNDTFIVNNAVDVVQAKSSGTNANTLLTSVNYVASANLQNIILTGTSDLNVTGGSAKDVIKANSGNDTLMAGSGIATLVGGTGNDTFVINNVADVIQAQSTGTNSNVMQSSVSYVMPANVQNITATGKGNIALTGNNLNNIITGNSGNDTLTAGSGNDTLVAGSGVTTLVGGTGNTTFVVNNIADVVQAKSTATNVNTIISSVNYVAPANVQNITGSGTRNLTLTGNTLNNVINANSGSDSLIGGSGNSVLDGGAGNDHLTEASGNGVLLGGAGTDVISGGIGRNFMAGGIGNDTLTTGSGSNIIAFNKGDGLDVVTAAAGANNTISLGGNFAYADLNFQKSGNNLILNMGTTEHVTLQNWYAGNNKVSDLQVIDAAMSDFKHGSTDALRNSNVEDFNFQALVTSFNQALTANPKLTSWALTNALLTDHLSSSDTTAFGGDLAYSYGTHGSLTGMNVAIAQNELSSAQFATAPQTLHPWGSVSGAAAQIR
jgi:Ca2+-binding RTX toxin-like protein